MSMFGKNSSIHHCFEALNSVEKLSHEQAMTIMAQLSEDPEFRIQRHLELIFHKHPTVRALALEQAKLSNDKRLVDPMLKACVGQEPDSRLRCCEVCFELDPARVRAKAGVLMASQELSIRELCLDIIQCAPNYLEYLGLAKAALRDGTAKLRHRMVRILAQHIDNETVFLMLRVHCNGNDEILRHLVLEAMASSLRPETIDVFFERLPVEGLDCKSMMINALKGYARSKPDEISKRLQPVLANQNRSMRETAVRLLAELPDQTAVLRSFLQYSKGLAFWLRERCFESIQKLSKDLVPALSTLLEDPDSDIRTNALGMLSQLHDERLIPAVQKVLQSQEDWWVRSMAAEYLAKFDDPNLENQIISMLNDSELRYSVIALLGNKNSKTATQALSQYLDDPAAGIRRGSMQSLGRQATDLSLEVLARACLKEKSSELQDFALELLRAYPHKAELVQQIELSLNKQSSASKQISEEQPQVEQLELSMENPSL